MQQITLQELENWQKEKRSFQLVDVREKEEHIAYNIGGVLIPLSDVMKNISKLELSNPIIFYCKRGIRSQIAIQKLQRRLPEGDFYNLQNGLKTVDDRRSLRLTTDGGHDENLPN